MHLVQIDIVRLQPPQAAFNGLEEMMARRADIVGFLPERKPALVEIITRSRRPWIALPRISSVVLLKYASAVSNMFSRVQRNIHQPRCFRHAARPRCLEIVAVPVPRLSAGTVNPERPSCLIRY